MTNENRDHCKHIALELDEIAKGNTLKCWECGEIYTAEDSDEPHCPNCGSEELDNDYYGLWDYFEDALDIEYTVDSDKNYKSVRIMVTCGGPNIFVNTKTGRVELYWWNESAHYDLDPDTVEAIDALFSEVFTW